MEFKTIASGSTGNCYQITSSESLLMIEAGLQRIQMIKKGGSPTAAGGCLITHSHGDHSKGAVELIRNAVDCYMSKGTAEELGVSGHRVHIIEARKQFSIGDWKILPFDTVHDTKEPLGFLVQDGIGDKLLFATDTGYIRYVFNGLTHIAIECNFDEDLVRQAVAEGHTNPSVAKRLYSSHMSLQSAKRMLMANDLSSVREIHLLHLSDNHSDEARFKDEIEKLTGKPVYIGQSL